MKPTMHPAMTLVTQYGSDVTRRVFMYSVDLFREKVQIINHQNRETGWKNVWQMRRIGQGFTGPWEGKYSTPDEALAALQAQF